jgi:hypothetical protein
MSDKGIDKVSENVSDQLANHAELKRNIKKDNNGNNMVPIFRIKIKDARSNHCRIKWVGNINETTKLGDQVVELDTPLHKDFQVVGRHAIPIRSLDGFSLLGRLYQCNIVGSHIVKSSRYPIMYINIEYQKPMVSGSLLQLLFSIDMDKEQKNQIKEVKNYVDLSFTGDFVRHVDCDDELTANYEKYVKEMLESDALDKFYNSEDPDIIEKRKTLSETEIIEWVDKYVANEKPEYDKIMKVQKNQTLRNITTLRDSFIELCMSDRFYNFLKVAMKARELHRRIEYGIEDNSNQYIVPKNVTKLDDVRQKMIENDELVLDDD